jgi:hypothetical protein
MTQLILPEIQEAVDKLQLAISEAERELAELAETRKEKTALPANLISDRTEPAATVFRVMPDCVTVLKADRHLKCDRHCRAGPR